MVFLLQRFIKTIEHLDIEEMCLALLSNSMLCSMYEANNLPAAEDNFNDVKFYAALRNSSGRPCIYVNW